MAPSPPPSKSSLDFILYDLRGLSPIRLPNGSMLVYNHVTAEWKTPSRHSSPPAQGNTDPELDNNFISYGASANKRRKKCSSQPSRSQNHDQASTDTSSAEDDLKHKREKQAVHNTDYRVGEKYHLGNMEGLLYTLFDQHHGIAQSGPNMLKSSLYFRKESSYKAAMDNLELFFHVMRNTTFSEQQIAAWGLNAGPRLLEVQEYARSKTDDEFRTAVNHDLSVRLLLDQMHHEKKRAGKVAAIDGEDGMSGHEDVRQVGAVTGEAATEGTEEQATGAQRTLPERPKKRKPSGMSRSKKSR